MTKDTGGPAFPCDDICIRSEEGKWIGDISSTGMTLRDYFAAKAMPVILEKWIEDAKQDGERYEVSDPDNDDGPSDLAYLAASDCYAMADAMLKAREL